ncbi:MAG TPA: DUF2723 domain-containing protein, partial [Vicinamibacterales bacterium]|nr:DUF2723 domain-containing protein [Vicinamibacterales bacterium]
MTIKSTFDIRHSTIGRKLLAAGAVAIASFWLYHRTLLPGFDFGDTGSFQAIVGNAIITPRDSYPLYFFLGGIGLRLAGGDPAHLLNLLSAIEAGIACGLMVLVAVELTSSIGAAMAAALLFATSYTFWSQSIIAEVYALHAVFVSLTLLLLLWWAARPSLRRLSVFFLIYALGFGNHLSMILLAPGYTVFLMMAAPRGWRDMVTWRVIVLAAVCASLGALQYGWNLRSLWLDGTPPVGLWGALRTFWFDVTKSDWRNTMVMNVPQSMWADHLAMYWFDLKQQFGLAGPLLAALGAFQLARTNLSRAALFSLLYLVNAGFAYSYNVGDTHVFYLPSHFIVALLAAPGLVCAGRILVNSTPLLAVLLSIYAGSRAYHDFPALDRSHDVRPTEVLSALTNGADDQHAI